jgi:hypothetical protein
MDTTRHDKPKTPRRVLRSVNRLLGAVDRLIAAADEAPRARDDLRKLGEAQGGDNVE